MTDKILEGGALEEVVSESDWTMGNVVDFSTIIPPEGKFKNKKIQYNQNRIERNTCTIVAAYGALSDYNGIEYSEDYIREVVQEAKTWNPPFNPDVGRYVHLAVKLVAEKEGYSFARVRLGSEDYRELLRKGRSLVTGYGGNSTYNRDRNDNLVVDSTNRGVATYHHAIRNTEDNNQKDTVVVDNYEGRTSGGKDSNVYGRKDLPGKIGESGEMFGRAYFYFEKIDFDMSNLPKHISRNEARTPKEREVVIAWEYEMSNHIKKGGKPLYVEYTADNDIDRSNAITRMLIDLSIIRSA